jgi:hypothetical protein
MKLFFLRWAEYDYNYANLEMPITQTTVRRAPLVWKKEIQASVLLWVWQFSSLMMFILSGQILREKRLIFTYFVVCKFSNDIFWHTNLRFW